MKVGWIRSMARRGLGLDLLNHLAYLLGLIGRMFLGGIYLYLLGSLGGQMNTSSYYLLSLYSTYYILYLYIFYFFNGFR